MTPSSYGWATLNSGSKKVVIGQTTDPADITSGYITFTLTATADGQSATATFDVEIVSGNPCYSETITYTGFTAGQTVTIFDTAFSETTTAVINDGSLCGGVSWSISPDLSPVVVLD